MAYTRSSPTNELPGVGSKRKGQVRPYTVPLKTASASPWFKNTLDSLRPPNSAPPQRGFRQGDPISQHPLGSQTIQRGPSLPSRFTSGLSQTSIGGGDRGAGLIGAMSRGAGRAFDYGLTGAFAGLERTGEMFQALGGKQPAPLGTMKNEQKLLGMMGFDGSQSGVNPKTGRNYTQKEMEQLLNLGRFLAGGGVSGMKKPDLATQPGPGVAGAAVPAASSGSTAGGTSSADSAATEQLKTEAANMNLYGDARGKFYGDDFRGTRVSAPLVDNQFPRPEFQNPTDEQMTAQIRRMRDTTGLTPQQIELAEEARRRTVADTINRSYNMQRATQEEINRQKEGYARALGSDLSGGAANITSTQVASIVNEMNRGRDELGELEQRRQDAIANNDVAFAQRIEDRIQTLAERERNLINDYNERIKDANAMTETNRRFGLDYAKEIAGQEKTNQEIRQSKAEIENLTRDDAQSVVNTLLEKYGKDAFSQLAPEQIAALEYQAGYPVGGLQRKLKTLDEKNKEAEQLKYYQADKYNRAGVFNPYTGEFKTLAQAEKEQADAEGASGLSAEQIAGLKQAYMAAPDKDLFMDQLPQKYKNLIITDVEVSGILTDTPTTTAETQRLKDVGDYIWFNRGKKSKSEAINDLIDSGVDPNDKAVKGMLDKAFGVSFFEKLGFK